MRYFNHQPAEGVNVSKRSPLAYFFKLLLLALIGIVLIVVLFNFLGASVARLVPFSYEAALMEKVEVNFGENQPRELTQYLNELANRLAAHMSVPEGIQFAVHYNTDDTFNAFATLGGNVVFYRELLRQMPNENALAMVVAHELAHVLHRDPLAGLSGGAASMTALTMLTGSSSIGGSVLNQAGMLTQLSFTREMEIAADRAALQALASHYGHVAGADTLFRLLGGIAYTSESTDSDAQRLKSWFQEISSSHPLDQHRIDAVRRIAAENNWQTSGVLTPLPANYRRWLR